MTTRIGAPYSFASCTLSLVWGKQPAASESNEHSKRKSNCRKPTFVGCDDEQHQIREEGAVCAHVDKALVTGRIQKRHHALRLRACCGIRTIEPKARMATVSKKENSLGMGLEPMTLSLKGSHSTN